MPSSSRRASQILILVASAALFTGCLGSVRTRPTKPAPCITESQKQLVIRWGTTDDSLRTTEQYTLNSKGEIFVYKGPLVEDVSSLTQQEVYLTHIEQDLYCQELASVNSTFLKTQALNVRGTKARYIERINPTTDVFLRAVWNPDLKTFQSRDMREEYDRLMELVNLK